MFGLNQNVKTTMVGWAGGLVFLICAYVMVPANAQVGRNQSGTMRWSRAPSSTREDFNKIKKVLVIIAPTATLQSQVCEDVLAVEFMSTRIDVVSREKREREQTQQLIEADRVVKSAEQAGESTSAKDSDESNKNIVDILSVAKAMGSHALVTARLLTDTIQRNIYDTESGRVKELRTELLVKAVSVTVVEVEEGNLLLAGFLVYSDGVSLLTAAKEIGEGLVEQLR
jgi:hypothetical protein